MKASRTSAACLGLLTAALAAPSTALGVPQVSVSKPCYREARNIDLAGTGFTPSSAVSVSLRYAEQTSTFELTSDATGNIFVNLPAPAVEGRPDALLTAVDTVLAAQGVPPEEHSASVGFQLTDWSISVPAWARGLLRPKFRTRVSATGWAHVAGQALYAHYVRNRRRVASQRIGVLASPCGDLDAPLRQPPRRLPPGSYTVYMDASPLWPNSVEGRIYRLRTTSTSSGR